MRRHHGVWHLPQRRRSVTLALIMESLRHRITEMGVDGFSFDLAQTLARQDGGFDQASAFSDLVS